MKLTKQQIQRLYKTGARPIPQFSKKTIWLARFVILGVLIVWILGGLWLNYQVKLDEQRIEQSRIEAQRRQEFLRRGAQYKQDLQQRNQPSKARNVFDGR